MQFPWKQSALAGGFLIIVGVACAVSFVVGAIVGQEQLYEKRYQEELRYIEERIKGNPAFSDVTMTPLSNGGVQLRGEVPTEDDLELLRSEVIRAVGKPRSKIAMGIVKARKPSTTPTP